MSDPITTVLAAAAVAVAIGLAALAGHGAAALDKRRRRRGQLPDGWAERHERRRRCRTS